ncbi:response regulator [Cellulomonas sp. PS-H5]|uniref:response regulator n=1 Tax=Cellulomonas sp. PS-H5 TaxID=2820400 RepID=UPI001C4E5994|nr:response regulator [Cellulomonas sp. PS-H5]MBW0252600.1 response regulator [Cellulomonas sp. PS-H5]
MLTSHNARVLLVEDDPGDRLLIEEVFDENGTSGNLTAVEDGELALDYLHRRGQFAQALRPDLILLDLNLPKVNGREVLADIKSDPDLTPIPVIVLTTSDAEEDVIRAYAAQASAYVTKPLNWDDLSVAVKRIGVFYLDIATLPTRERT